MTKLKILFLCGRELNYTRNQILHNALASFSCLTTIADKGRSGFILGRSIKINLLAAREMARSTYDFVFIGFYGYLLVPWINSISRTPIIFDPFVSNLDTLIYDRKIASSRTVLSRASYILDQYAIKTAKHNLLDTNAHIDYFVQTFGVQRNKFSRIYVSCDENLFQPAHNLECLNEVLFYGTFLPIHGIDVIVRAAKIVSQFSNIRFRLIGRGQEYMRIVSLVSQLELKNIIFDQPVPLEQLPTIISKAKICLGGHFGASDKAKRVIAGKTFQCLAMGKPVIVGDNQANHELLTHNSDALFCKMNDPQALAESILLLNDDEGLCRRLSENARKTFVEKASPGVINREMANLFQSFNRSV